jgi:hypothetical protein
MLTVISSIGLGNPCWETWIEEGDVSVDPHMVLIKVCKGASPYTRPLASNAHVAVS